MRGATLLLSTFQNLIPALQTLIFGCNTSSRPHNIFGYSSVSDSCFAQKSKSVNRKQVSQHAPPHGRYLVPNFTVCAITGTPRRVLLNACASFFPQLSGVSRVNACEITVAYFPQHAIHATVTSHTLNSAIYAQGEIQAQRYKIQTNHNTQSPNSKKNRRRVFYTRTSAVLLNPSG